MGICKTEVLCAIRFIPLWAIILFLILLKLVGALFRRAVMAGATKLSIRTIIAVAAISAGYGVSRVNLRNLLQNTLTGPGSTSRIVAILVVLANLKNFPLVWHVRVLSTIVKHMEFASHKFSPTGNGPSSLFQPAITSSRSPIYECDYNFHKSNSTYFTDADVARSNIMCILTREGIKKLTRTPQVVIGPDGVPATGSWSIMLGAVSCSFKREIKPYEAYEMWSRILCWDRKWIYVVTHFVKKGAVKPAGYTLNAPSSYMLMSLFGIKDKNPASTRTKEPVAEGSSSESQNGIPLEPKVPNKAIFATSIGKYVMKLGRLTVHPEVVMEASGLLPPKPGGWDTMSGKKASHQIHMNGDFNGSIYSEDEWDWKRIEAENARGMEFAKHFAALDGLDQTFTGKDTPALGFYRDVL